MWTAWLEKSNYFALLKHPLLGPLGTELLDVLKHVEDDVLHVHCGFKRNTEKSEAMETSPTSVNRGEQRVNWLLTKTLLGQVHVDDEEHEATGSFLLPSHQGVDPALKTHPQSGSGGHQHDLCYSVLCVVSTRGHHAPLFPTQEAPRWDRR